VSVFVGLHRLEISWSFTMSLLLGGAVVLVTIVGVVLPLKRFRDKAAEAKAAEAKRAAQNAYAAQRRYCRGCGGRLHKIPLCKSSIRLQVRPLEFDPASGKRWYENVKGKYEWAAFCEERKHTHSVVRMSHEFCSCTSGLNIKMGHYSFEVQILDPTLIDGDYVVLSGTCDCEFCGSCGIADPTNQPNGQKHGFSNR
jgi:hypothetical protein